MHALLQCVLTGKGGKTKQKIARVSAAEMDLREKELIMVCSGTRVAVERAEKYTRCLMEQRKGPVTVTKEMDSTSMTGFLTN